MPCIAVERNDKPNNSSIRLSWHLVSNVEDYESRSENGIEFFLLVIAVCLVEIVSPSKVKLSGSNVGVISSATKYSFA